MSRILVFLAACAGHLIAADDWRLAVPGWDYQFPRDHAVHPEFRTEWWYFTGLLHEEAERPYGFQVTFFRQGLRRDLTPGISRFVMADLKFAHFTIADVQAGRFFFWQKTARGAFGEAGFGTFAHSPAEARLAWIEDWQVRWKAEGGFELETSSTTHRLKLTLVPAKNLVIHGENGVSQKAEGEGRASHYYSFTRLKAEGELDVEGKPRQVKGEVWFDHEWASNQLTPQQVGWNWFSMQFNDDTELMLYQMRLQDGGIDPNSSGTFVDAEGKAVHLRAADYQLTPLSYWEKYPISWHVQIPKLQFDAEVKTPLKDQELRLREIPYWEGLIEISGHRAGQEVLGHGYLELTGYRQPLNPLRTGD